MKETRGSVAEAAALIEAGRGDEAESMLRALCSAHPGDVEPRLGLGRLLYMGKRAAAAAAVLEQAVARAPADRDALYLLGRARIDSGVHAEAVVPLERLVTLAPEWGPGWLALADALGGCGRVDAAEDCFVGALTRAPGLAIAWYNFGNLLLQVGRTEEAIAHYRKALELDPDFRRGHSNLLYALNFSDAAAPEAVFDEHRAWGARFAEPLTAAATPLPQRGRADGKLRVGYVSPNFRDHAAAYFFEPVLAHHDRAAFEVHCYSDVATPDTRTARLRAYGHVWHDTSALSDEALAVRVRQDGIDILVDLTGHTRGDRLLVFARRAAPLQITWNGYANTTGLSAMDYRITDAYADPPGMTEHLHTERLLRLPEIYMPFAEPLETVSAGNAPSIDRGFITFGAFNLPSKVTPRLLRAWAKLLHTLPGSRLLMLAVPEGRTHERFMRTFVDHGVDPTRIEMRPRIAHGAFLEAHAQIDIALDTFPQSGTTTTAHGLWMGVPVVTLAGRTHASRVGVSMLSNAGLAELVARSEDEYIAIACALARDPDRLQRLRTRLRERMRSGPNMDGARFTRHLEQAYARIWDDHVRSSQRDIQP